ncbi:MAG: Gfo/Idh/MocA family oxidoreductase [Acidobacteriota bacterium]|nr:Gfo/Idh/MocA family oxidoreductase [Acidobacteriota bacterium]
MSASYRWGIIGTGGIARAFAKGLSLLPEAKLVAVGSRTRAAADRFAQDFRVPRAHASYEDLAADPEVDIVYVATPHILHRENSLLALRHGKAVLCEKAFTINAAEAAEVFALARGKGLFVMEAMWTRFLPAIVKVREMLAAGAIGEPRWLQADFGFRAPFNPQSRIFAPELGGGALLDVGIYPVSLASMVFGRPTNISAKARLGSTGVDEQDAIILSHDGGALAALNACVTMTTPTEAVIAGEKGLLTIQAPFFRSRRISLGLNKLAGLSEKRMTRLRRAARMIPAVSRLRGRLEGRGGRSIRAPYPGNGLQYEAAEVMRCLHDGLTESPVMPWAETLAIMETMDAIRAQWGLVYPGEKR